MFIIVHSGDLSAVSVLKYTLKSHIELGKHRH